MESRVSISEEEIRILTVMWRDHAIGYLMREDGVGYLYKYNVEGMKKAREEGFPYLIGFKDLRKVYSSSELFPVFKSRIPTRQRRDLEEKLAMHGINGYDEFEYLVASRGRLFTDEIEVIEDEVIKAHIERNKKRLSAYNKKAKEYLYQKRSDKPVDKDMSRE